jgi:hypothetical protein
MFNLQLNLYTKLSQQQRAKLPEVVNEKLVSDISNRIKKAWKNSLKKRLKNIENYIQTNIPLTKKCYRDYLFNHIELNLENIISLLHVFFKINKSYTINPIFLIRLSELVIERVANENEGLANANASTFANAHAYFCIVNTIVNAPHKVKITYEQFKYVMKLFDNQILRELCIFVFNME